jgi:lipoate-protein ligase A
MLYIEPESTDAAFNFAAEEHCMANFARDMPIFMLWRADKCVMLGMNQIAEAEINLRAAQGAGVGIFRRSSGGGTIYADLGVVQYTAILPFAGGDDASRLGNAYLAEPMARALNAMGVSAARAGRNDIEAGGKKISGLAQHCSHGRLCTHGSLLYDADLTALERVLNADPGKLQAKAIRSARARVDNVRRILNCGGSGSGPGAGPGAEPAEFFALLKRQLLDAWGECAECGREGGLREYRLTESDVEGINAIRTAKYANPDWIFGKSPPFSLHRAKRYPGGKVELFLGIKGGVVESCRIKGDFMGVLPCRALEERLEGRLYQYASIAAELGGAAELKPYLGGVSKDELLDCMFGDT